MRRLFTALVTVLAFAMTVAAGPAQEASPPTNLKTIGGTQKTQVEPALIVMNAAGAKREGGKLTLIGAAPNAIISTDRPVRAAGHALTAHLLQEWAEGSDSFAKDAPNATVSVFSRTAAASRTPW